jgi:poly(hydroxyalkanoate) depolymerase family esterase
MKPFQNNSAAAKARLPQLQRLMAWTQDIQNALSGRGVVTDEESPPTQTDTPPILPTSIFPARGATRLVSPLKDVVGTLRAAKATASGKRKPAGLRRAGTPEVPSGAKFIERTYVNHAGERHYKLYIPGKALPGKRPLLLMLHGCKQNPDDFAAGTRMNALGDAHGMLVAYPAQSNSANMSACWNWFDPAHQLPGAGEPSILAGLTQEIIAEHKIDPTRVFVAGLSAGGSMALVLAAAYPNLFAAAGVHSGLAYQSANDVMSAFAAMRGDARPARPQPSVRKIIFQGNADRTVHPSNAASIAHAARGHKPQTSKHNAPGSNGWGYAKTVWRDENGAAQMEKWIVEGAGHAWSGGSSKGSFTDPKGPDASAEMVRFFLSENVRQSA